MTHKYYVIIINIYSFRDYCYDIFHKLNNLLKNIVLPFKKEFLIKSTILSKSLHKFLSLK